jgi:hypothetical protein
VQSTEYYQLFYLQDWIVGPLYVVIFWFLTRRMVTHNRQIPNVGRILYTGFILRIAGMIAFAVIMQYNYGQGDVFRYYNGAVQFRSLFMADYKSALTALFERYSEYTPLMKNYLGDYQFNVSESTVIISRIAGVINLFCFNSYIGIALVFTFLSFLGCWYVFKVFYQYLPALKNHFAFSMLFLPTTWYWGSGIVKDPLCIFGIGIMIKVLFEILMNYKINTGRIIAFAVGALIVYSIKPYLLYAFLVSIALLCIIQILKLIRRIIGLPIFGISIMLLLILMFFNSDIILEGIGNMVGFDNLATKAEKLQDIMGESTQKDNGTGYELPPVTLTVTGIINTFFSSVNVSLFRPYPWEIKKLINIPMLMESLLLFFILVKAIVLLRIRVISILIKDNILLFCLLYTLGIGAVVGFISFNYGTLARYRAPVLPIIFCLAFILVHRGKKPLEAHTEQTTPANLLKNE